MSPDHMNEFVGKSANQNRFNEQITSYDKMGNILGLLRYGQTSATGYGLIDNLNLVYNGNQLQSVDNHASNSVYGNGMEFKDNANQPVEYGYDKNGNLTKDLNKNISNIRYNLINLPSQITFSDDNTIDCEYGSDGRKLRTVHQTGSTILTTDYCGNAIYENGSLKLLLTEVGYISFPDKKFHFYLKNHQGNVRVVDKDGKLEEMNDYYPFGGTFTTSTGVQPYKYNGKELDKRNGMDWYDYGARMYDAALGCWHAPDPFGESSLFFTLYGYCKNNPMNRIDIGGKWDVTVHVHKNREVFGYGFLGVTDKSGNTVYNTTVRVEGSNSERNGFNKRDRTRTYADTPTGMYMIKGWSKRLSNLNRQAYGANAVLELDYVSGEAFGLRNGIYLHGGRQEGKGGKGKGSMLKVTQGCLRIYDEDIAKMKYLMDVLEAEDREEDGGILTVVDDLERIEDGPEPRPFDYPRKRNDKKRNNDIQGFLIRLLQENQNVKYYVE